MTAEFFEGFLDDYFSECEEHLTAARAALLALETSAGQRPSQQRIVDDLFRYFHSLKGISAMVELRPAEQLAHEIETLSSGGAGGRRRGDGGRHRPVDRGHATARTDCQRASRRQRAAADRRGRRANRGRDPAASIAARHARRWRRDTGRGRTGEVRSWKCTFAPTRELFARGSGSMRYASGSAKSGRSSRPFRS